jgi:hypothetical protein
VIFLSSGDDAATLRDLADALVRDAVNPELRASGSSLRVEIDRWERTAAERTFGDRVNEQFVKRALQSHRTLALLIDEVRPGTREEIEAVLASPDVDLSVLWFVERTSWPSSDAGAMLDEIKEHLFIDRAGPPDGHGAVVALVRLLMHVALSDTTPAQEAFVEHRG